MMRKLVTIAYSSRLDFSRFTSLRWSLLSNHQNACNLLATDGTLVALVNEVHGNGPFHIVVRDGYFGDIAHDASIRWQKTRLQLDSMMIDLSTALPWAPHLPSLTNHCSPIQLQSQSQLHQSATLSAMRSALYNGPPVITGRAQQGIALLQSGLAAHDESRLVQGVELLAGLGPGLTPAGDDFLVGFMASLWFQEGQVAQCSQRCTQIANVASARTTRLSGSWLTSAGRGDFGMQWHRLVDALNSGNQIAVDQARHAIFNTGATSGADALCGFFSGLPITHHQPATQHGA